MLPGKEWVIWIFIIERQGIRHFMSSSFQAHNILHKYYADFRELNFMMDLSEKDYRTNSYGGAYGNVPQIRLDGIQSIR